MTGRRRLPAARSGRLTVGLGALGLRATVCAALLCVAASAVSAQPEFDVRRLALVHRVPFERVPGERTTLRVVRARAEREGAVLVDSTRGAWEVEERVLAARPRSYTFAWTYRAEGDAPGLREPRFDLATNTLEGRPIVFRTDTAGTPYQIANGDSLRAALDGALRRLAPRLDPTDRVLLDGVRATAASNSGLEDMLLSDADRFHLASGSRYPVGRPVTYRSVLPNPFGGPPIPALARFELRRRAPGDSVLTVQWRQTPDSEALARILIDMLNEVAPGGPRLSPAEVARRFGIEERATYVLDPETGRPLRMTYLKTVRFGDRTRTERLTIGRLPGGA